MLALKAGESSRFKKIIDFSTYTKHLTLIDNEFLYCKRVGNPIEYIECKYEDLTSQNLKKKNKVKIECEYITISKNVNN